MTPLLTRALVLRLVSVVAGAIGFYLPLAALPMLAADHGTAAAAGLANGALLVFTVAGELVTPRLLARLGCRWVLAVGLVLLGLPALVLLTPAGSYVVAIVAVNAVRGIGFALSVVAGGALTAALLPADRRGEGLALVGLVGGVPTLLALPFGTWAAAHWGYGVVLVLTAVVPLVAVATVPALPARDGGSEPSHGLVAGLRNAALVRPAAIFASTAAAAGVVVTYLPLAVGDHAAWVAPAALLAQPATSTAGRWCSGRLGDRRGQTRLLVPGVLMSLVGMAAMALTASGPVVVGGALLFGAGFGVLQNATLALMYARVPAAEYGTVSAIWNGAYDLGMGAGALAVGVLVTATGFSAAFLVVAAAMLPALGMARGESGRRSAARAQRSPQPAYVVSS
ncbi:MFS transporter [Nocardioides panacisoli]|uniref:MFS transporter n=1 Tax=Nocardioides panacisoli TaxID=627624 RepID=A0ABP7HSK5_9ACTN